MKKTMWLLVLAIILSGILIAQEDVIYEKTEGEDTETNSYEEVTETMIEIIDTLEDIEIVINIPAEERTSDGAYMGVYTKEITLAKASELNYSNFYGILISSVEDNSPAYEFRLISNDIIMQIDDIKIKGKSHFTQVLKPYRVGDKVALTFFRNGKVNRINFVFGSHKTKFTHTDGKLVVDYVKDTDENISKHKRLNAGDGGIGWTPTFYQGDFESINETFYKFGFEKDMLDEDGTIIGGFAFQGDVGNNWMVGMQHNSFEDSKTTKFDWLISEDETLEDTKRKGTYDFEYWGFTFDKRFALSRKFITSIGFMFGFGESEIKISQSYETTDATNKDFTKDLEDDLNNNIIYKSKLYLEKDYIVAQPKIMFMWHPLDWFGIRAEAGYLLSYSGKGWKAKLNGDSISYDDAPDDNLDGLTVSIGPWFGF